MSTPEPLTAIMLRLAIKTGGAAIVQSGGLWEMILPSDPPILVAIAGKADGKTSTGATVPAFTAYAEGNGWPLLVASFGCGEEMALHGATEDIRAALLAAEAAA